MTLAASIYPTGLELYSSSSCCVKGCNRINRQGAKDAKRRREKKRIRTKRFCFSLSFLGVHGALAVNLLVALRIPFPRDGRNIPNKCRGIAAAGEQSFAVREKSQRLNYSVMATKRA
jgi:hypothetical protein